MNAPDTIYFSQRYSCMRYERTYDTDLAYVRADIPQQYADSVDRLEKTVEAQKAEIRALLDELVKYRDRIERLRGALNRYGDHSPNCTRFGPGVAGDDCSCGFAAALKGEA